MQPALDRRAAMVAPPRRASPATIVAVYGCVALVVALRVLALFGTTATGELIDPVDPNVAAGGVFVGTLAALLLVGWMISRWRNDGTVRSASSLGSRIVCLAGMMIAIPLATTGMTQLIVQQVAFVGLDPVASVEPFTVIGTVETHRYRHRFIELRLGQEGRVFGMRALEAAYAAARPGDTVMLPVQTGRYHLRRAILGRWLRPDDLHHPG